MIPQMGRQNIHDFLASCKHHLDVGIGEWGLVAIIVLTAFGSFGLGRLSALVDARPPVSLSQAPEKAAPAALAMGGLVVASRSGSVYYYPWCAGAGNIAPQNQRWFADERSAQAAGLHPAKNCKGLAQ
jgi:hypothetical protein